MAPGALNFVQRGVAGRCRLRLRPLCEVVDPAAPFLQLGILLPNVRSAGFATATKCKALELTSTGSTAQPRLGQPRPEPGARQPTRQVRSSLEYPLRASIVRRRTSKNEKGRKPTLSVRLNPERLGITQVRLARRDPCRRRLSRPRAANVGRYFPMISNLARPRYARNPNRFPRRREGAPALQTGDQGHEAGPMTSAVSMFGHKSEFDPFLYAPVGERETECC